MRALRTSYTDEWEQRTDEIQRFPEQSWRASQDGVWGILAGPEAGLDPERDCMPAGQSAGGIRAIKPCRAIVADVVREAETVLSRLPG